MYQTCAGYEKQLHPRAPAAPEHERGPARDDGRRGADPERGAPARGALARALAGRDVARGDERVEVREEGRADERGVGDDAKVAAEVREAPDRGEDPWPVCGCVVRSEIARRWAGMQC